MRRKSKLISAKRAFAGGYRIGLEDDGDVGMCTISLLNIEARAAWLDGFDAGKRAAPLPARNLRD